ncbi:hypothetical protein KIN20_005259 [Parelaphostrongylus tenuis]|uniref:Uncharacterized protein n=1 Tax=Parelaphostrongylus tenuis TaxID=148309 RepID=A0AAD5QJY9_PARTN|nr:hypothetical protein KIN20_005259 [Parelaphostrongylus tenuis]
MTRVEPGHVADIGYQMTKQNLISNADPTAINTAGFSAQAIALIQGNRQMATYIAGFNGKRRSRSLSHMSDYIAETTFGNSMSMSQSLSPVFCEDVFA